MEGIYHFGEQNIRILSLYRAVHDYCAQWRTDADEDVIAADVKKALTALRSIGALDE